MIDVAIVGAGPYGLSLAAHLRSRAVTFRIFGRPMATWLHHMPQGMYLKSDGFASSLSAPCGDYTLRSYCARHDIPYDDRKIPVALSTFTAYGQAFQRQFVPDVEEHDVTQLVAVDGSFLLELGSGERVRSRSVILAVGISHFDYVPEVLRAGDSRFVSHSSKSPSSHALRGKDVTIVGGGSSAIEIAASLHEAGAHVRVVARRGDIRFSSAPTNKSRSLWQRMRHPESGLGPGLRSRIYCELPHAFRYLPGALRLRLVRRHLGPASPWHLRARIMGKISVLTGREVEGVTESDDRVQLHLRGGQSPSVISTDHIIAATGYRVDLRRLPFLEKGLAAQISTVGHMPQLSAAFETPVRGLHFVGPAAAGSFGPLLRFVYGADFAARRISEHLVSEYAGAK